MRRPRLQFKLPAIFALMTIVAVACVWFPWALSTAIELVAYITFVVLLGFVALLAVIGSRE